MRNINWKSLLPHLIAIGIFILVAAIFCKPAIEGKVLSQGDVMHWQGMYQDMKLQKEKTGVQPLWNNSLFGGMPGYQISLRSENYLSPIWLHSLFTLGLPKPINMFFLLCIGFYFLAQVFKVKPWLSILGAIAYAYASYSPVIVSAGHDTKMLAMGYMPALIGAYWLILQRKYLWGTTFTAIFTALLIGMNHLQVTYYTLIVLVFATIYFVIQQIKTKDYSHLIKAGALAIVGALLGASTNLVNLATTNDYAKATMRGGSLKLDTAANAKGTKSAGLSTEYAFAWSYGINESLTFFVPGSFGGSSGGELKTGSKIAKSLAEKGIPEDQADQFATSLPTYWGAQTLGTSGPVYFGALICLLFILGMVYLDTPAKWWIFGASVFAILLSWGKNFGAFNNFIFEYMPLYNKFRAPTMSLIIPQLLFPLMAVLALQKFLFDDTDPIKATNKLKLTAYITIGLIAIAGIIYMGGDYSNSGDENIKNVFNQVAQGNKDEANKLYNVFKEDRKSLFGKDLLRSIVLVGLGFGLLWAYAQKKLKLNLVLAGLILLVTVDAWQVAKRYLHYDNFFEAEELNESQFRQTAADAAILKDTTDYRVLNLGSDVFNDAITSYYHRSIGGYHPAKLAIYEDLLNFHLRKQPMNMNVVNMLNTKYVIINDPQSRQPIAQNNPGSLGSCWLVKQVSFADGPLAVMKALDNFNPADTAFLDKTDEKNIQQPVFDSTASIKLIKNNHDDISYSFSAKSNQFAVFSEIFYNRGWKAFIDDKEVAIYQTNYVLRGMNIPAGNHTIRFEFKPASYYNSNKAAMVASVITWLLLLGATGLAFRQKK